MKSSNSLSFDEFSALRRRQLASTTESSSDRAPLSPAPSTPKLNANNAGYFFETFEVQLLTLCLIAFDVVAAMTTMLLTCNGAPESGSAAVRAALNVMESFTGFTIFFFILELAALMVAFKGSFFVHMGNLMDVAVVGVCLAWEVQGESRGRSLRGLTPDTTYSGVFVTPPSLRWPGIRMLGLLRFWRVMRLIATVLAKKDRELDRTNEGWQADQQVPPPPALAGPSDCTYLTQRAISSATLASRGVAFRGGAP